MERCIAILLFGLSAIACAAPARRADPSDQVTFMQAFEIIQMTGGDSVLLVSHTEHGRASIYYLAPEPMDRLVYLWGEDGPAAPLFFSMKAAAMFSILQANAVSELKLSTKDADEWAWTKLHEPLKPKAER